MDYKKILDKQLELLIEEQELSIKHENSFDFDLSAKICELAKNLLVLTPAGSPSEFREKVKEMYVNPDC